MKQSLVKALVETGYEVAMFEPDYYPNIVSVKDVTDVDKIAAELEAKGEAFEIMKITDLKFGLFELHTETKDPIFGYNSSMLKRLFEVGNRVLDKELPRLSEDLVYLCSLPNVTQWTKEALMAETLKGKDADIEEMLQRLITVSAEYAQRLFFTFDSAIFSNAFFEGKEVDEVLMELYRENRGFMISSISCNHSTQIFPRDEQLEEFLRKTVDYRFIEKSPELFGIFTPGWTNIKKIDEDMRAYTKYYKAYVQSTIETPARAKEAQAWVFGRYCTSYDLEYNKDCKKAVADAQVKVVF